MKGYWKDGNKFIKNNLSWHIKNAKLKRSLNKHYGTFTGSFYNVVPLDWKAEEKTIYLVVIAVEKGDSTEIHKILAHKTHRNARAIYDFNIISWDQWRYNWWKETAALNGNNDK